MATYQEENSLKEALAKNLDALLSISIDSLIKKEELGASLNFEEGRPYFERIIKLFNDLKEANLDNASFEALNQCYNITTSTINLFKQFIEFSIEKYPNNTKNQRDSFLQSIQNEYDNVYRNLTPHIAYAIRKGTDFKQLEDNAKKYVEKVMNLAVDFQSQQVKANKEADDILKSMRKAAAETGVSQHSLYFNIEANENKTQAETWFKYTKWAAGVTIGFAIIATGLYIWLGQGLKFESAIQLIVAKILIFSILYYATIWCGKNYRAYLHNYIVNKHRQNGLSTFQAFVNATTDEATKNAVLLRSTESIFGLTSSGFVPNENESSGGPQILEIIKSGLETKSGKG